MFAFVEHWHKETSSFHFPIGEMAITLDDMALLLHVPIIGAFHSFEQLHVDDAINMLVELLKVSAAEARAEMIQCHGSYVQLSWLQDVYQMKIEVCHWIVAARAYLLHLLGCTRFANKSDTHVHEVFLDAQGIKEHDKAACMIYHFVTMLDLQAFHVCWFPLATGEYDERRLRACQWTSGKA
ncbi:Protein MAIN-LIKE 1 [Glycine max]|nr:Protein MAIN-LIKE 1 [Glycine max]